MTMMFWKLEGRQPAESAPREPLDTRSALVKESPDTSITSARSIEQAMDLQSAEPFAPLLLEPRIGYEGAALAAMRYLADTLGIPHWVFLRHYRGVLATTVGIGEYQRYVPTGALPVSRLAELPTIDLLGTASTNAWRSRDAAAIAPYGAPIVRADGSVFGVLCTFADRISSAQIQPDRRVVEFACEMLRQAVLTDLVLVEAGRSQPELHSPQFHPIAPTPGTSAKRFGWDKMLAAAVVASLAPAALAILGLTLASRQAAPPHDGKGRNSQNGSQNGKTAEAVSLLRRLSADDRRLLQSLLHAGV
jgi:hypothetical protein